MAFSNLNLWFQKCGSDWPISGAVSIPKGTVINTYEPYLAANPQDGWSQMFRQSGLYPPPNAQPLDQNTFDVMTSVYPKWMIFATVGGPPNFYPIDRSRGYNTPSVIFEQPPPPDWFGYTPPGGHPWPPAQFWYAPEHPK